MKQPEIKEYNLRETPVIAQWLYDLMGDTKVFCMKGELGAGKTTLIKEFVKLLGVHEAVTSPTYTIVNEYQSNDGKTLYHMDLYRLQSIEEAYEIGIEEMLDSGNICIIEWPEIIEPIFGGNNLLVRIDHIDENTRSIQLTW